MTLTQILEAKGQATPFKTLADFIKWARLTVGDSFATSEETETLLEVREHGFAVAKDYIKQGLVTVGDLDQWERAETEPPCIECGLIEGCRARTGES